MFICIGNTEDNMVGQGNTLKAAFDDYQRNDGRDPADECNFYEGT